VRRPSAIAPAVAATLVLAACGSDNESATTAKTTSTATEAAQSTATAEKPPAKGCKGVAAPEPKGEQSLSKPKKALASGKRYVVRMTTNCGSFDFALDTKRAPKTAASVAALVKGGFYDGLTFHRIAHGADGGPFVIQGGDPLGTGNGGPGYSVVEAPPKDLKYTRGVVAMAKTAAEAPGTSGSQFYVVTAPDAGLPPEYALVGKVVKGQDVVDRIAGVPTGPPPNEPPVSPVVIEQAKLLVR
jgi:cyclophilin family peptidyl-prolyl cis-trans isomerase